MEATIFKKVRLVLWLILFANFAVALLKIVVGTLIKSTSMTADGFHSLADGSSNIVGLIGIHLASKPVDDDHPYGHHKFETLAGLAIAGMLFVISGKIITDAFSRFAHPIPLEINIESLITLIITLCINIFVCVFEYRRGKELNSQILISDSMHTRSDIYVSFGVLAALVGVKLGLPPIIDPITSLIVSGVILHAAYEIFRDNSDILVDKAAVSTERIKEIVMSFEQVRNVHDIRSRGDQNDLYIDMHIMTAPGMSIEESHVLIHSIENKMREEINSNVQVIAHLEPFYDVEQQS